MLQGKDSELYLYRPVLCLAVSPTNSVLFHGPEKDTDRLKSLLGVSYVCVFLGIPLHAQHTMKDIQLMRIHSTFGFTVSFQWAVSCFVLIRSIHVILQGHKYWFPCGFFFCSTFHYIMWMIHKIIIFIFCEMTGWYSFPILQIS